MTSNQSQAGTIIASVLITLALCGAGMFFGMPLIFPQLNMDPDEIADKEDLGNYVLKNETDNYVLKNETVDDGILLQSKYHEFTNNTYLSDQSFTPEIIIGSTVNITTEGNSKLYISFQALFLFTLQADFENYARYNITLFISGIAQKSTRISELRNTQLINSEQSTYIVDIFMESQTLPAGTYTIYATAESMTDASSHSFITTGWSGDDYPSAIYIQELKA